MKKTVLLFSLVILFLALPLFATGVFADDNINHPQIYSQPVIKWGNSAYHDSLGARDPWIVKNNGTYFLYYDCTEDLLNPSFESALDTNGWSTYEADISTTVDGTARFGSKSLKIVTHVVPNGGAYTGDYYYQNLKVASNLAVPGGLEVTPNTTYIASVYALAGSGVQTSLIVKQYKDDPSFYWQNWLSTLDTQQSLSHYSQWQRHVVKFTTSAQTRVVTLSFVAGANSISFWDGVMMERVEASQNQPSDFPTTINYNKPLEDTVGWRSCLATSADGINFQKKGSLEVQGAKQSWQDVVKPGWVGTDSMYLNVFPYNNKWYAYTWVAGYPLTSGIFLSDSGQNGVRRRGYADMRAFVPNGSPVRSALLIADRPEGPFQRVSGPIVLSNNPSACDLSVRTNNQPWGCEYLAASGAPQQVNGQWVLFLSGQTWYQKSAPTPWGSWANLSTCKGDFINSGLAVAASPLGPWTIHSISPLFKPADVCQNALWPEGPIYYYDTTSGNHVLFTNQLTNMSITAFWTKNPLSDWPVNNRQVILDQMANGAIPGAKDMNLPTVLEESNKLVMYFGFKEDRGDYSQRNTKYLFHDIGRLSFDLPLFGTLIPSPSPTPISHVNILDLRQLISSFTNIFQYNQLAKDYGK